MTKKRNKKIYLKGVVVFVGILLLVSIIYIPFLGKIFPNIYISGIYLGNKNDEQAEIYFKNKFILPEKITLVTDESKNQVLTSEIVTSINYQATIDRAFNYASSGNIFVDFVTRVSLTIKPVDLLPIISFNEDKLLETLLIISDKAGTKPVYPSASKVNGAVVINEGKDGVEVDIKKARQDVGSYLASNLNGEIQISLKEIKTKLSGFETEKFQANADKLLGKKIELKLDYDTIIISDSELISFLTPTGFSDELIKEKILEISKKLNRSPQDSVFMVENGTVIEFTPSKDGIIVDENQLLIMIKDVPSEINIPVIKTSPKIKNEDVNNLGIKTLLGKGFSNFKGSIPNRIYNVNLAQSKFRGILVPPNETVSFNDILGDVSNLTGYKAAYVIKDGKTVLGDGGGVCQVSTTLFRAVLSAGLPVVERRAHAYRVGYYEQGFGPGLDATVYSPTTDFKFKNDTSAHILIQTEIDLNNLSLTFEIYGTDDGRVATTSKPIITSSTAPAEDLYVDDPTLPVGQIKQIEHRAYGAKVIFDYKVTRNGEELINQKFISNYRPWQAVYLRGTAQ
ncbi:MAG: VanW family protein [uncultured bacterium]|nr:MAG: VanW family protein [uncultured bacterium]